MPKLWEALLTLAILIAALAVGIIIFPCHAGSIHDLIPGLPMGDRRAGERGIFCILQAAFHPCVVPV